MGSVDATAAPAAATAATATHVTGADGAATGGASGNGEGRRGRALRTRPAKAQLELLEEAGGLRLHLDPRRHMEGYDGTGYKGVFDDYWPCGYKK